MAYSYDDFLAEANKEGVSFSSYDLNLAKQYPEFGLSLVSLKKQYKNAGSDAERRKANDAANELRKSYGNYTGGQDGSQYISLGRLPSQIDAAQEALQNFGSFQFDREAPVYKNPYAERQQALLDSLENIGSFTYDTKAPAYTNQYASQQQKLLDSLLNYKAFSYNKNQDPQWGAYKKAYLREGDRAAADALGQAAAAAGGRPSSYAATAASQAGDYYASKLSDVLPTLYQQAYERYLGEYSRKQQDLSAVNAQEQLDYNRYLDELNQYNTDRNFALTTWQGERDAVLDQISAVNALQSQDYNQYLTELEQYNTDREFAYDDYLNQFEMQEQQLTALQQQDNTDYSRYLDQLNWQRQEEETAYQRQQDAYQQRQDEYAWQQDALRQQQESYWQQQEAYEEQQADNQKLMRSQVDAILKAGGMPSESLIAGSGYSPEYIQTLAAYYARLAEEEAAEQAAKGSSGGKTSGTSRPSTSHSGTSSTGSGSASPVQDYQGLYQAAKESQTPKSFIYNNYKRFGFSSSTGLYDDYQNWLEQEKETGGAWSAEDKETGIPRPVQGSEIYTNSRVTGLKNTVRYAANGQMTVLVDGMGYFTLPELERMVRNRVVEKRLDPLSGFYVYRKLLG